MSRQSNALALIESPAYEEALEAIRSDLIDMFLATGPFETDSLQNVRLRIHALDELDAQIRQVAETP